MKFSKSFLKSKTFRFNALGLVANYAGLLPLAPETVVPVVLGANVGLRFITKGAVYVLKNAARE